MTDAIRTLSGHRVLVCAGDGPTIGRDAVELIGAALGFGAEVVVVPVGRLDDAFLELSTRMAGEFVQKLVNYALHLVVVGDISRALGESSALRDFVRECNRGSQIWFVTDERDLIRRLERRR